MRTSESMPDPAGRAVLRRKIENTAAKAEAPDPELYAMMYLSTREGVRRENWRHLRNMAAVQIEYVTNPADTAPGAELAIRAIRSMLIPQIRHLRGFKDGWFYRSSEFRAAFEDVCAIQEKHYQHDRPSKKLLKAHENNRH